MLFTFPSRYWFAIGHQGVFSLGRWFAQIPAVLLLPPYSGTSSRKSGRLSPTGLSPSVALLSRQLRLDAGLVTSRLTPDEAPQPRPHKATGLGCSPFARHYSGNRVRFLFLGVLRWFTSPGSPSAPKRWGCPIREPPDLRLFTPPRSLSQLATPFLASWCQGIHRGPLVA